MKVQCQPVVPHYLSVNMRFRDIHAPISMTLVESIGRMGGGTWAKIILPCKKCTASQDSWTSVSREHCGNRK